MATIESPSRRSQSVRVYIRNRSGHVQVVGVERTW